MPPNPLKRWMQITFFVLRSGSLHVFMLSQLEEEDSSKFKEEDASKMSECKHSEEEKNLDSNYDINHFTE